MADEYVAEGSALLNPVLILGLHSSQTALSQSKARCPSYQLLERSAVPLRTVTAEANAIAADSGSRDQPCHRRCCRPELFQRVCVLVSVSPLSCANCSNNSKQKLDEASTDQADTVLLKLLGLPVGDRTIDTDTSISIKYLREIVRDSKKGQKTAEVENEESVEASSS